METVTPDFIRSNLYRPPKESHKGQNGKLTIVGGSKLFHGASLWALKVASRIVDMVYYASVLENLELVKDLEKNLYDFIAVPLGKEADYIAESDAVLIGPGMVRGEAEESGTGESGEETKLRALSLLHQFPQKKWILDAGVLQVIEVEELKKLGQVIVTPHAKEFENLFEGELSNIAIKPQKDFSNSSHRLIQPGSESGNQRGRQYSDKAIEQLSEQVKDKAKQYGCIVVLKGKTDIICAPDGKCLLNETGNEGMTKGGTGDVLAGLIAALACKNELFVAAAAGTYINGLAGNELYQKVGPYFNASDLANQIPQTLAEVGNLTHMLR
ncbi:hypothetical protein A2160_04410 [Candidatus Beckwithbacteria bacterium RBG_13_42_9]|uniref:ADP-dependent (S)-NAD(P)H-hydrate dehydratase n=1 Tax=Candidatus Beckwithbacteria bacterium RBG_13_42_9 TaxID=1797457 RepID=A0A1F5E6E6_9BACT|nr:MAG: hypothetical protein A2160_04410 [Candidatus Beckwithbacteria bacterium RBG_13_42_9]